MPGFRCYRRRKQYSAVIAVASFAGTLADRWLPSRIDAMEAGLDLVSGMHSHLVYLMCWNLTLARAASAVD